ncbi:hypothetical protein [Haloactinomyces albus]|uniref:Abi-like protein n=1 Tax=Haloactinomyces albus TaxID=1352928 RepID=A0AAE3ZFF8_9ACTN|nr:hypothetical protein [Haloactinomyces albus]MDR7302039.1 hypothetical protein [Haloactinomyces albus]
MIDSNSKARRATLAGGDVDVAFRLYQWNPEVCSAFYGPMHWLEIGLRNALNDTLRGHYGRDDWWTSAPLDDNGHRMVGNARGELVEEARRKKHSRRNVMEPCADDIVAKLAFGSWVSLLSRGKAYDRYLWVPLLYKAFPNYSGPRRPLHSELEKMRRLRNRIMHYEPVFEHDLHSYRAGIYRQLGYLSPVIADQARRFDRIPEVLGRYDEVWDGNDRPDDDEGEDRR